MNTNRSRNILNPGISIVIPAFNEEKFLPATMESINLARQNFEERFSLPTEIVVVDNASTDNTGQIAQNLGAKVIFHKIRNIASVRNAGIRDSSYDLVVTVDADTLIPIHALVNIWESMRTGDYIGGGVKLGLQSKRLHFIFFLFIIEHLVVAFSRLSAGMFFFSRKSALEIGGFPESHLAAEDIAFAKALRDHGKKSGKKFLNLRSVKILTRDRKDVSILENLKAFYVGAKAFMGANLSTKDLEYWYKPKR